MTTKKFPKQDLLDLLDEDTVEGYGYISDKMVGKSRWSLQYRLIFSHEGRFWQTTYRVGATEQQDERPWENDGNEIECIEVVPIKKTITVYEVAK